MNPLFAELSEKAKIRPEGSLTVDELDKGTHFIGKKIIEEAGETWMAAEYEGADRTAEEMSQLLYHVQVMMIKHGLTLEDVYKHPVIAVPRPQNTEPSTKGFAGNSAGNSPQNAVTAAHRTPQQGEEHSC